MQLTPFQAVVYDLVGPDVFGRALPYARNGAVRTISIEGDRISGRVAGTARTPYATLVQLTTRADGELLDFRSICSCPVGQDCKHAVALMIAVDLAQTPGPAIPAVVAAPAWEQALTSVVRTASAPDERSAPVALQFEITGVVPELSVTLRPVLPGRNGWVRTGIGWNNLHPLLYGRGVPAEAQYRQLTELLALFNAGASMYSGYYYVSRSVRLEEFASRRLWDLLAELRATGVPFVGSRKSDGPVVLHTAAATAALDLRADGGGVRIEPRLSLAGATLPAVRQLLGTPAHGLLWTEPSGNGVSLHLARFADLDVDPRAITGMPSVSVPVADLPRFSDDYLLTLCDTTPVISSDESVALPDGGAPTLVLRAEHALGRLRLQWSWRYGVEPSSFTARFDSTATGSRLRDSAAEATLQAAAVEACHASPLLIDPATGGLVPGVTLHAAEVLVFAGQVLPALEAVPGVRLELDGPELHYTEATSAPSIQFDADPEAQGRDWLELDVSVRVDGHSVPFAELFRALAEGQEVMLLPNGVWFRLDRPEFAQLAELIAESRTLYDAEPGQVRVNRYQAGVWSELESLGEVHGQVAAWQASMRGLLATEATAPELPGTLHAELRPYQQVGFGWLTHLHSHGLGGVLADEMGLGKTLQCLALICHARLRDPGAPPFLVVTPTSVMSNWAAEAARFAPELRVVVAGETSRRSGVPTSDLAAGADIVITSYALFRIDREQVAATSWAGLLLDEAQFVKNHRSQAFACAAALDTPFKLAITGTPMENNLTELWAMFAIVAPGLFPRAKVFEQYYRTPIEKGQDTALLGRLRTRIRPFMLRRTKSEVAADLPAKQEQVLELDLDARHRKAYQTLLARERRKVLGLLSDFDRNQFEILRSLTLLRQASLHVGLVDPKLASVPSTKLDELLSMLAELAADGHRVVVFSQFTRFLELVRARLDSAGLTYTYLDGRTRNRAAVIARFKDGDAPVFLISLKAGGFGLNLTEADYCVLLDPWWNPAVEAQAVDRVHRIGQSRSVTVYRLVARDTIEQKVMALQQAKAALFASVIDDGDWSGGRLSADEIRELLS